MSAGKIIGYIFAGILIFFGVLFIWATFSPEGQLGWLIVGIISVAIGFGIIWLMGRRKPETASGNSNTTINIDFPANVNLDELTCKNCGGTLTMDNITMVAGAPVVSCPYCKTTYQLTEEPKW